MMEGEHGCRGEEPVLISHYELELCPPPCVPGAATWSARASLNANIDAVLPYLNARLEGAEYDHDARVLVWKAEGHSFAFRSREIKAAPAEDRQEAQGLIDRAVALANDAWREREDIEPRYEKRTGANLMQIYRLLPRTNCGRCGCATCMAFAAELREGKTELARCTELEQPGHADSRRALSAMLRAAGRMG
jgi:ArsR family metal-binding transcriptional regulator